MGSRRGAGWASVRPASAPRRPPRSPRSEPSRAGWSTLLPHCASGRELVEDGFAADVALAAAYDVSDVVPVLTGDAFADGQES